MRDRTGTNTVFALLFFTLLTLMTACGGSGGGGGGGGGNDTGAVLYTIGGTVSGLAATGLVMQDNGADDLAVSASGPFTFATQLADGATYSITIKTQPVGQTCTALNNSGTVAGSDVTSASVICSTNAYSIGGTVSGLASAGLVLQNNGADDLAVSASGPFTFATQLADGATYSITIKTQPAGQTCTALNNTGTVAGSDVTSASVICSTNAYSIGGTISGLSGTVVLQNNGANDLTVSANGPFTFTIYVADGGGYNVTVKTQPAGQTCTPSNNSGAVAGANITNVSVTCVNNPHIYLTDSGNNRIVRMDDMTGAGWISLGSTGTGTKQFQLPSGIHVDGGGKIYVTDSGNNRIVRMDDMTGAGWISLGSSGSGTKQFSSPLGIFVDTGGKIYVADTGNNRIVRMDDMTGSGWTSLGSSGSGVNQFSAPQDIVVDTGGKIFVTDFFNGAYQNCRIVRIDNMTGAGWTTYGSPGSGGAGLFGWPTGIVTDSAGKIYVADQNTPNNWIVRMDDMTGAGWTTFGTFGTGTNQFKYPTGVSIDPYGKIYVPDSGNNRIVRINDFTGSGWTTLGSSGTGTKQFSSPYDIYVK